MTLLDVTSVGKRFGGVVALDDVSLSMEKGEILGLVGPNGSGKSTLINLLSGFYPADRGGVVFEGTDIGPLPAHHIASLGIARTYQIPRPFDTMTPRENIAVSYMFGRRRHTLAEARTAAGEWLAFTGLESVADIGVDQLTLHQLKFLELARALATEPTLLLLDEVLAGLNPTEIDQSMDMIRRIHTQGVTLLVVEHVIRAITALSSRIVVLDQGLVVADGDPDKVMSDPAVVAAYLGSKGRRDAPG
ncbi:MAG: ABC transporter ATP-binding protein [Acidimicrobiia bacterium]